MSRMTSPEASIYLALAAALAASFWLVAAVRHADHDVATITVDAGQSMDGE